MLGAWSKKEINDIKARETIKNIAAVKDINGRQGFEKTRGIWDY